MVNTLNAAGLLLYFVAYTTVIFLSRYLSFGPEIGAPLFWPASGLLFAMLLIAKPKDWWIYAVLGLLANVIGNWLSGVPNTALLLGLWPIRFTGMAVGVSIFRRFSRHIPEYSPERAILFVLCGGVLTPAFSATASALSYQFFDSASFGETFRAHFAGSSLGILTLTPFLLALFQLWDERKEKVDWPSLGLNCSILLATFILNLIIFATNYLPRTIHYELLVVPLLIAISFRGNTALTATSNLMISIFAFYRVMDDQTFLLTTGESYNALHNVQFFVGVTTLTHLLLTAAVRRRAAITSALGEKTRELWAVNQELDLARREAMAASEAKSYFLANMSHEIRSPLTAMIGYADLIERPDENTEDKSKYGTIISRNGHHLLELVNQILDLSKIEAGQFEIHPEPVKLRIAIDAVSEIMSRRARDKGLEYRVEWSSGVPEFVTTDDLRVRQILINGLGNAIKFTDQGKVVLRISSSMDVTGRHRLRFEIEDTGIGLDSEEQKKLFRAFQQANSEVSRRYGGTGLGLELSRRLARLMAGNYELITSEKGRGSTFVLEIDGGLPLRKSATETRRIEKVPLAPPLPARLHGLNILLVDDAADNRFLITRFLQMSGATVDSAENGKKALERIDEENFDLILMDIEMPEMNGLEATRRLREMHYEGPVLALTGRAMPQEISECLEAGFDGHLVKPVDRDVLIQSVAQWTKPHPLVKTYSPAPQPLH